MNRIIALNFKAYAESAGSAGLKLAQIVEQAAGTNNKIDFIACPQSPQLQLLAGKFHAARFFAQGVDAVEPGAVTGWLPAESIAASGAAGTLVNHSEHRLKPEEIKFVVEKCRKLGLQAMVCAESLEKALQVASLGPWAVAYEPPEFIGSGISVSKAQPEVVGEFVKKMRKQFPKVIPVVGAGVSTPQDVKTCFALGAQGVLLASAFVKAKEPAKLLGEMAGVT